MARRAVLRGDVQLRNNLKRLSKVYTGPTLDHDIEAALDPLVIQTEANARPLRDYPGKWPSPFFPPPVTPPKGGHLDEGVASKRVAIKGNLKRTWWVAFRKRARKIAHLVEFGTAPHRQPNFNKGFNHPGASPRPFFRPAFEAKKGVVVETFSRRAAARLNAAAARLKTR